MAKIALLIGVSEYEPGLDGLPSAVNDVTAMQHVLTHPDMGEFADGDVTVLPNPSRQAMEDAIYHLFANRAREDLVLLYFSGHGVVDEGGEFYFASRFTRKDQGRLVPTTAVASQPVRKWMQDSRSQRKVIILDSCFSSAFARGVTVKDSGSVNPEQFLGGKGTAILTASTRYAETREDFDLSVYTHYLVEGIRTGGADQDDDGLIAIEELHVYASSKVKEAAPAMTPEFYGVKDGDKILLAKSPKDDPSLKYRKQVKLLAEEDEGDFSFINRHYLNELQRSLSLLPDDAAAIETEELEPYRQRRAKVDRYRMVFEGAINTRYPLTDRDRLGLQRLQQLLSLRDEDVTAIEAPLLVPKQTEYERQQVELALLEFEKRQQEQARQQQQRQRELEQQRVEQERQKRLAAQRQSSPPATTPPPPREAKSDALLQPFEFEIARLVIVKKQGLFSSKTAIEVNRSRGQAEYFAENLGNGIALDMVAIPGGTFQMGSEECDSEKPIHTVTVEPFFMGKFPVTQAQYEAIVGTNPSGFKGAKRPVEEVSWDDAIAFCTQLSQKTGKTYRLPSEAEWEYACRAGTTTPFYFGETMTPDLANYDGTNTYGEGPKGTYRKQTTDVGSFPANAFGLYDMHGNVWEWCADPWHGNYNGAPTDGSAWMTNGNSEGRLRRGGSWSYNPVHCRAAYRYYFAPAYRYRNVGFRVVCSVFPGLS